MAEPKETAGRRSLPDAGGRSVISSALAAGLGLAVVIGGAIAYRSFSGPGPETAPSGSASAAAAAPRCAEVAPGKSAVIGKNTSASPATGASDESAERDDLLSPFAVILGRAVALESGWAVGVQGEGEKGTMSSVVLVDADGTSAETVPLSTSRGDLDPPVVAVAPSGLVVALIEPNASSRAVRLARVVDKKVTWGAELREDMDESLALDVAVAGDRGVVAWDALDDDQSFVSLAGFDVNAIGNASEPRRLTPKGTDAEAPRVVPRPGGFYAVYQVRGDERARHAARPGPVEPEPTQKPKAGPKTKREPGEADESRGGEAVVYTWLEVLLLDASGAPSGDALRLTPDDGHVISFDVAAAADGGLVVAYRDEDSPTGAGGGTVKALRIGPGGGVAESFQSDEGTPSDGAPTLLPGWMAIPTLRGPDLLGRLGSGGVPAEPLLVEASLGRGEPIAAKADRLLLAEPEGKAMRVRVVTCGERAAPVPDPSAAPFSGP